MSESTELQAAVERLTSSINQLRADLVRKDVYDADQRLVARRLDDIGDDVADLRLSATKAEDRRASDRRLLLTSFALPLVLLIIQLWLAAQTGGTA